MAKFQQQAVTIIFNGEKMGPVDLAVTNSGGIHRAVNISEEKYHQGKPPP